MASISIFFPNDRERNAASETMSLRMLINEVFRCAVKCVLTECCHLSTSFSVVSLRVFKTVREGKFTSVNCGRKLRGGLATAELSLCRPRKPTMSTNKTKKVKMATKSCPECDQQVRQHIPKNSTANAFDVVWLTVIPNVKNATRLSDKNGAYGCFLAHA